MGIGGGMERDITAPISAEATGGGGGAGGGGGGGASAVTLLAGSPVFDAHPVSSAVAATLAKTNPRNRISVSLRFASVDRVAESAWRE